VAWFNGAGTPRPRSFPRTPSFEPKAHRGRPRACDLGGTEDPGDICRETEMRWPHPPIAGPAGRPKAHRGRPRACDLGGTRTAPLYAKHGLLRGELGGGGVGRGGRWEAVGSTGRMKGEGRGSGALATRHCVPLCPVARQGEEDGCGNRRGGPRGQRKTTCSLGESKRVGAAQSETGRGIEPAKTV